MKLITVIAVGLFAFSSFGIAQDCRKISGEYSTNKVDFENKIFVVTVNNESCDSIAVGSYYLSDGEMSDEIESAVLYTLEDSADLCEVRKCSTFENTADGVRFIRSNRVRIDGKTCKNSEVIWSKNAEGNLDQKYIIDDNSPQCKNVESLVKTLFAVDAQ